MAEEQSTKVGRVVNLNVPYADDTWRLLDKPAAEEKLADGTAFVPYTVAGLNRHNGLQHTGGPIEKLTEEQMARFKEFVDKWTAIGLSTAPIDKEEATKAINLVYTCGGLAPPKEIQWFGSPMAMVRAFHAARIADGQMKEGSDISDSMSGIVYGAHEAGWLSFYDYMREVLGLYEQVERLAGLVQLAKTTGWIIPCEGICFVSERHCELHRDSQGRLNNKTGPACAYPDGFKIYAVNGVRVPPFVITNPEKITVAVIDKEENAEVRRVMLEQYGVVRFLKDAGATKLDSSPRGILWRRQVPGDEDIVVLEMLNSTSEPDGSLSRDQALEKFHPDTPVSHDGMMIRLAEAPASLRFKEYMEQVPPEMTTALEAAAWQCYTTPEQLEKVGFAVET